jgi:septin 7
MDDFDYANWDIATATANGSATALPEKATSPVPSNSSKATSPFVERSNPMGGATNAQTVTSKDPKAAAQAASDMRNVVRRKLTGYVGFANLPNQWHRKSVRKGFNFNVMVVGKLLRTLILSSTARLTLLSR